MNIQKITKYIWNDAMEKYKMELLKLIGSNTKIAHLLDCGCGDGILTNEIITKLNIDVAKVSCIDNFEIAAEKAKRFGFNVTISDLNKPFPFEDNKFDAIFSNFTIEHLFDIDNFVSEIHRVLKPSGYAIVGTENLSCYHNIFALILGKQPFPMTIALSSKYRLGNSLQTGNLDKISPLESPHIRVFAYEGLADIFKIYKFNIENIVGVGFPPFTGLISDVCSKIFFKNTLFILIKIRKL